MPLQRINDRQKGIAAAHAARLSAAWTQQLLHVHCNMNGSCCTKGCSKTAKTARIAPGLIYWKRRATVHSTSRPRG